MDGYSGAVVAVNATGSTDSKVHPASTPSASNHMRSDASGYILLLSCTSINLLTEKQRSVKHECGSRQSWDWKDVLYGVPSYLSKVSTLCL